MNHFKAEGALILTTIIWGGTFVIVKESLAYLSPMMFISSRFLFAAILLLPFIKKIFEGSGSAELKGGLIIGVLYFLGFATQTIGLNYTSATKSGFITGTFVIFTPLFQLLIEKRIPSKWNLFGIGFVIIGLLFLSSKGNSAIDVFTEIGNNFNIGDFFTLLCAISYSLYIVYLDIISKKARFMPLVFIQIAFTGIAGVVFAIIFFATGLESIRFEFNSYIIIALLYTSILATILTTSLQTRFQKYVSPTKAGIIFSFEPIFAAIFAYIIISERIGYFGIIGGIFIFSGLIVSEIFDKRNTEQ